MLDNWSYMSAAELQDMNSKGITGCQGWSSWSALPGLLIQIWQQQFSSNLPQVLFPLHASHVWLCCRLTPTAPWLDVNALGQEGAFINLVTHAGFEDPDLCKVNIPITGSMDQMKQMSIRGLLSTALAAEQQRR